MCTWYRDGVSLLASWMLTLRSGEALQKTRPAKRSRVFMVRMNRFLASRETPARSP